MRSTTPTAWQNSWPSSPAIQRTAAPEPVRARGAHRFNSPRQARPGRDKVSVASDLRGGGRQSDGRTRQKLERLESRVEGRRTMTAFADPQKGLAGARVCLRQSQI